MPLLGGICAFYPCVILPFCKDDALALQIFKKEGDVMRKSLVLLLVLCMIAVFLPSCGEKNAELPSSAVLARFGIKDTFPRVATLSSVSEEAELLRLKFTNADDGALDELIVFLQEEGFTSLGGSPAEKLKAVSGRFFSFTAEQTVSAGQVRVMASYFVKSGSFDGEDAAVGDLFVRFSVVTSGNGAEQTVELPRSSDYVLPQNLRAELFFSGELLLAVKIGDTYYSERYGAAYFYLPRADGTYTEYLRTDDTYFENKTISSRVAVEYLVFGLMLDAGEYDFPAMDEQESIERFGRRLSVYTEAHEGITETVWYDPASRLIFFASASVEGYGSQMSEVRSFDETVVDFGSIPLPS